jgi:hypothetical protein
MIFVMGMIAMISIRSIKAITLIIQIIVQDNEHAKIYDK